MSEDVILSYVRSIDERTARMEIANNESRQDHDKRLKSLENSRTAARAGLAALTIGGTGAGAKMGLIDKLVSIFGGQS